MHSFASFITAIVAVAASTVLAEVHGDHADKALVAARGYQLPNALGAVPAFPTADAVPIVHVRAGSIDYSCASSVLTQLSPPTNVAPALSSWADTATQRNAPCTVTAPASLSSELLSYYDEVRTYLSTVESKASGIHTKCGADTFSLTFSSYCRSSQTAIFTNAANQTSSTVLPAFSVPSRPIYIGAAASNRGVLGMAVGLAAVMGVVVAL